MSKCLVLFVEGDTEVEFYRRVISNEMCIRDRLIYWWNSLHFG